MQKNYRLMLQKGLLVFLIFFSSAGLTTVNLQGRISQINVDDFIYSTYLGGSNKDIIRDGIIDSQGNIIVTGQTLSEDFPVLNPIQDTFAGGDDDFHTIGGDAIISKFNSEGQLIWSTYYGGSNRDSGQKILVDESNNLYIVGVTNSDDFPVTNDSIEPTYNGGTYDLFLLKIASNGSLIYSSYFGTEGDEYTEDAEIDSSGNIIIVGSTSSGNFPITENAFQSSIRGGMGGFIISWANDFKTVVHCTYFDGSGGDVVGSIALDPEDNIFVSGVTTSIVFPITDDAYQSEYDSTARDFYLAKFNSSFELEYSTFFGGTGPDDCFSIALDSKGNMYFSGRTWSSDFPMENAFQETLTEETVDAYIASLETNGQDLQFSTYTGGSGWDTILQVEVDKFDNVLGFGFGGPDGFPIKHAFQETNSGSTDLVIILVTTSGEPIFCSYFGGSMDEMSRNAYLTTNYSLIVGETSSHDFPVSPNAYQQEFQGYSEEEGFFLRFDYVNYLDTLNVKTKVKSTSSMEFILLALALIFLRKKKIKK
ncbi:MAG: SBBP repeat-containing protein [Candidatus Hodarchaeales archaeon]|jgi:hypothetical protein